MNIQGNGISERFQALAHPNRVELLSLLQEARTLEKLEIGPVQSDGKGNPDRVLTREGVRHHLNKLVNAGLVDVRGIRHNGHTVHEYVASKRGLFQMSQMLLAAAASPTFDPEDPHETLLAQHADDLHQGPRLELLNGFEPGKVFPLDRARPSDGRGWVIGSDPSTDIALPHDPKLADEHAEIVERSSGGGFELVDLRSSGPTYHEWNKLDLGTSVPLERGDVIRVGACLLIFKT